MAGQPPGLRGSTGGSEGFGAVGEAGACYNTMACLMIWAGEVRDSVEADSINVEKYVKELAA